MFFNQYGPRGDTKLIRLTTAHPTIFESKITAVCYSRLVWVALPRSIYGIEYTDVDEKSVRAPMSPKQQLH